MNQKMFDFVLFDMPEAKGNFEREWHVFVYVGVMPWFVNNNSQTVWWLNFIFVMWMHLIQYKNQIISGRGQRSTEVKLCKPWKQVRHVWTSYFIYLSRKTAGVKGHLWSTVVTTLLSQ